MSSKYIDTSFIFAHRGPTLGLWASICSIESQVMGNREYCVVVNGKEIDEPLLVLQDRMGDQLKIKHVPEAVHPATARDMAVEMATGRNLMFFDDHIVLDYKFCKECHIIDNTVTHFSYRTHPGNKVVNRYYHFMPNPDLPTKGDYATKASSAKPYEVISGPHGGFVMTRATWDKIGGYGDWMQGFGGEEAYFGYKAWLAGCKVVMDPTSIYYHFSARSETRGYDKTINEWNYEEGLRRLGVENVHAVIQQFEEIMA